MRYFLLERTYAEPHVREEYATEEAAREAADIDDVFTDEQLAIDPELEAALARWDCGDRSRLMRDYARDVLAHLLDDDRGFRYAWDLAESFNDYEPFGRHASAEPACAIVAELLEAIDRTVIRARALGIPDDRGLIVSQRWHDWVGMIRLHPERLAAESLAAALLPRPSFVHVTLAGVKELAGYRLRRAREERDLTVADLARLAGTTPEWIELMEAGRSDDTPADVCAGIARTLGVRFDWIVGLSDDPTPDPGS